MNARSDHQPTWSGCKNLSSDVLHAGLKKIMIFMREKIGFFLFKSDLIFFIYLYFLNLVYRYLYRCLNL